MVRITTMTGVVKVPPLTNTQLDLYRRMFHMMLDGVNMVEHRGAFTRPNTLVEIDAGFSIRGVPARIVHRGLAYTRTNGRVVSNFYNQISFKYTPNTKRCIKVFSNGTMHCSGFVSKEEMVQDTLVVYQAMFGEKPVGAVGVDIHMTNAVWNIPAVDLHHLAARAHDIGLTPAVGSAGGGQFSRMVFVGRGSVDGGDHQTYKLVMTHHGSVMYTSKDDVLIPEAYRVTQLIPKLL